MSKLKKVLIVSGLSLFWFVVLPFKFNNGWSSFGGYKIIKADSPFSTGFQHEIDMSNVVYSPHAFLLLLILVSLTLGFASYKAIKTLKLQARFLGGG